MLVCASVCENIPNKTSLINLITPTHTFDAKMKHLQKYHKKLELLRNFSASPHCGKKKSLFYKTSNVNQILKE